MLTAFSVAGLTEGSSGLLPHPVCWGSWFWLKYLQKLGFTEARGCKGEVPRCGVTPQGCAKVASGSFFTFGSRGESTYLSMDFSNSLQSRENESEKGKLSCEHSQRVSGTPQGSLGHTLSTLSS